METERAAKGLKAGLWLCWIGILTSPVGLLAVGGGPCAGPDSILGSVILLSVGATGVAGAAFGLPKVWSGIKVEPPMRPWGLVSLCGASLAGLIGVLYVFVGFSSLSVYLRLRP